MLDVQPEELDEAEKTFVTNIREYGWAATHVAEEADLLGFSYTTGFWHHFGQPELILFSLPPESAHQIFWIFAEAYEAKQTFPEDQPFEGVLDQWDVILKTVSKGHYPCYVNWSRWFYNGEDFPQQQLFFPAATGDFPWEPNAPEDFVNLQPNLSKPLAK
ncbi:DUF4262 domain-containing protein [Tritonibacter litoralis]|nr:DUF4262 domain-containing protein [Tritonibacter litoralis]